jgi:hypothetical protein
VNFRFSIFDFRLPEWALVSRRSMIAVLAGALPAGELTAQGNSSLPESKVENEERAVTAAALGGQNLYIRKQIWIKQESGRTFSTTQAGRKSGGF